MIEQTWLVFALSIGISYDEFWHYTPHEINLVTEAYNRKQERKLEYDNLVAFVQGRYMVDALLSTVGNMFSKKGSKTIEYPQKPYDLNPQEYRELTEEEKQAQVKAIFDNLERMKANFERAKEGSDI